MTALLKDAIRPNLVQTLEHTPAFVHGGPFANIAHGANSIIATRLAFKLADYVVTEAGFGSDLGAEKFMNIVCREGGLRPVGSRDGGDDPFSEDERRCGVQGSPSGEPGGVEQRAREPEAPHRERSKLRTAGGGGVESLRPGHAGEVRWIMEKCAHLGVAVIESTVWEHGSKGGGSSPRLVTTIESIPSDFKYLYEDELPLWKKIEAVAHNIYGAREVEATKATATRSAGCIEAGHGNLPVCMAKTQYSFSSDPKLLGAPKHFDLTVRDVRLAAGRGVRHRLLR